MPAAAPATHLVAGHSPAPQPLDPARPSSGAAPPSRSERDANPFPEALLGLGLGGLTGFVGAVAGSPFGLRGAVLGSYIGAAVGAVGGVAALAMFLQHQRTGG